jgi:uroporphyrinogen-III decarboxylase
VNHRERFEAVLAGRSPDRIPWVPRLQIWYEAHHRMGTLPQKYQNCSLREIEQDLGAGTPARNGRVFRTEMGDVETHEQKQGYETVTEYITPVGAVSTKQMLTVELESVGIVGQEVEHLIKRQEDYPAVEYLIEHTSIIPTYDSYLAYEDEIGEAGLPIVPIGQDPMNRILQELIGYNTAFYHLYDYPGLVAHLFEVVQAKSLEIQQVVLDSPAKLILYGEHFDSHMTPPPLFKKYMVPHFQSFADRLHANGKFLACHADADSTLLLDLIKEAGFDMAECFVTAPMVPVTIDQARRVWGKDVIIWGGIPSTVLCDPFTDEEFESYMANLFRAIAPGDAFILGVADNAMPETRFERLQRVSEMVEQYGEYPVRWG